MDRNTITGLVLIFAILIGYSLWMTPSEEERLANQHRLDSIANVNRINDSLRNVALLKKSQQDSIRGSQETIQSDGIQETPNDNSTSAPVVNRDKFGVFANSSFVKENSPYEIENDLMKIKISPYGGKIVSVLLKEFQTFDSLPLELFDEQATNFGLTFFAKNRKIQTNNLYFQASDISSLKVSGSQK